MRIVVATHNPAKGREMRELLASLCPGLELATFADFPGAPEPEETGSSYADNATIKARAAAELTGLPAVADDAGLEIDALGGRPGHHSRRFAGEDTPFAQKMRLILEEMADVPEEARTARFRCFVAMAQPDPGAPIALFDAVCEGRIARAPSGTGGFGYDPIFWLPELGCTMADLTVDQKHAISHRGKVMRQLGIWLASQAAGPAGR